MYLDITTLHLIQVNIMNVLGTKGSEWNLRQLHWDEDWNTKKTKKNLKVRVEVKDDIQNQTDDDVSTEETFKSVIKGEDVRR